MKLIEWLQRLGILRFGAQGGVYHNSKERPLSLQMGDVYDPDKDVIDLNKRSPEKPTPPAKKA